jgi:hypothetical protein
MSIICCAACRLTSAGVPVTGSGISPKCTAAVCASDKTNAGKLMPDASCDSDVVSAASSAMVVKIRMVA